MIKKTSFLEALLEKGTIGEHACSITLKNGSNSVFQTSPESMSRSRQSTHIYTDVPDYMNVSFFQNDSGAYKKSVATFEGSYIDLSKYEDLHHFLKTKLSPKRVSKLRAYKRTLEQVFSIEYQYYYGTIDDSTYDQLMSSLKRMISKRFNERQLEHMALTEWDTFEEQGKKLIQEKRAALIVIYHKDRPIHISFNYIWEKLVFGYVRGFDIDYSKFYLGYIDIMLQLDWCFKHQFKIYDLLRENLTYKLRFADYTYLYRTHIVCTQKPIYKNLTALLSWLSLSLKFDVYYPGIGKLKGLYHKIPFLPKGQRTIKPLYHFEDVLEEERTRIEKQQLEPIKIDSGHKDNLKRAAYHFLYISKDKLENLEVYREVGNSDSFFMVGTKKMKKVRFNKS